MVEWTMIRTYLPTSRHRRLTGCAKQRKQRAVQADDGRGVDLSLLMTGYSVPDVHYRSTLLCMHCIGFQMHAWSPLCYMYLCAGCHAAPSGLFE